MRVSKATQIFSGEFVSIWAALFGMKLRYYTWSTGVVRLGSTAGRAAGFLSGVLVGRSAGDSAGIFPGRNGASAGFVTGKVTGSVSGCVAGWGSLSIITPTRSVVVGILPPVYS